MQLINKATGESSLVTAAGAKVLLKRGTHELPSKPKTKPAEKKTAAESEE